MAPTPPHVVIVGAGLAGALLACSFGRRGYRVSLCEQRPDPRESGFIGGRSINLALSTRGITALERVGLAERVLDDVIPMRGRMMHSVGGDLTFQPYSKDPGEAINSVSRGGLNLVLLEAAAAHDSVELRFGLRCADLDLEGPSVTFVEDDTGETKTIQADLIVGADGAFSAVRGRMQKTDRFDFSQSYLAHGYKELVIPPTADGGFAMEPEALHIWPRGGFMMIALPNQDRSFTCTCFWPFAGPHGFDGLDGDESVRAYFRQWFGDAVPLMPKLVEDYRGNPTSSLCTIRCAPWHHEGRVVILGDAAHAVVPFYGQGMNCAFEDCRVLDELIDEHGPDWDRVLPAFTETRKQHADAIADLALSNFIEMRDKVGSRVFLMRKKFEKLVHRLFPGSYTPLYNLVSFSNVPYDDARDRAARQDRIVYGALTAAIVLLIALFATVVLLLV